MKLTAFKVVHEQPHLEVWERVSVELPVAQVLDERIVSADPKPVTDPDDPPLTSRAAKLGVRERNGSVWTVTGLVVASRATALLDFLVNRYEPLGDGEIECMIRRVRAERRSKAKLRARLEDMLPANDHPRRHLVRDANKRWGLSPACFVPESVLSDGVLRLELSTGAYVFPRSEACAIACEHELRIGNVAVPRRSFVVRPEDRGEPVLYWDGARMQALRDVNDVPAEFLDAAEARGSSPADLSRFTVAMPELCTRFVVAVPPREALECVAERRPDLDVLLRPALLFDSRDPVPLPADAAERLPVVDDPAGVRWMLARTSRDRVYVPSTARARDSLPATLPACLLGALPALPT